MAKKDKPKPAPLPPLDLGGWLSFFEIKETEAGDLAGCGQPYIANLVSGRKKNPSVALLYRLSEKLGITINDLYRKAPTRRSQISEIADLSPRARATVLDRILKTKDSA